MAKRSFELNINLDNVDKGKIFIGKKGKYYKTIVYLNEELDAYGNTGTVKTSTSKEERDAGYVASYLGNLKEINWEKKPETQEKVEEDLPF